MGTEPRAVSRCKSSPHLLSTDSSEICTTPPIFFCRSVFMTLPSGATRGLIHVLVADSNQTQSQLLSSALRRQPGMRVMSCDNRLSDCLEALRSVPADVVAVSDGP